MNLARLEKLEKLWKYAFDNEANVILMRHAPKSGSDDSDLSTEGARLAIKYGFLLNSGFQLDSKGAVLACTSKARTARTLKLLFPSHCANTPYAFYRPANLEVNRVTPFVQDQVDALHRQVGRFGGYLPNHTYYFLENLGGRFDEENLHTVVAKRMALGIRALFDFQRIAIYCGHSPSIEVGLERLLWMSLSELGGFLNPLDSFHLRLNRGKVELIARINPIIGYVDLENETYF